MELRFDVTNWNRYELEMFRIFKGARDECRKANVTHCELEPATNKAFHTQAAAIKRGELLGILDIIQQFNQTGKPDHALRGLLGAIDELVEKWDSGFEPLTESEIEPNVPDEVIEVVDNVAASEPTEGSSTSSTEEEEDPEEQKSSTP